ncbi:hypothetical protein PGTUg99_018050 [Puccinia graminis f. sp. tritici]|uniref:Uncharacterized protein n=1 Tax=Puccinia graminis f. sp. tritici TaxID=56615 RepID=A0A5B0NJL7_PUCGR|nr:hypothetical protein PGTUg99_018050 [Puccinia graminis f. sp. tritici]
MGWCGAGGGNDTTNPGDEEADRQPLLIESSLHPAKRSSLLEYTRQLPTQLNDIESANKSIIILHGLFDSNNNSRSLASQATQKTAYFWSIPFFSHLHYWAVY